jgi:uncharacterized protein
LSETQRQFSNRTLSQPLGVGLGLRSMHYSHILETRPQVSWFEAISENYMGLSTLSSSGGRLPQILESIRRDYPLVLHGVSLSIGSTDDLDFKYLENLKNLYARFEPAWVSDHLCWTGVEGENLHDLLPLPYTEEALDHIVERVSRVQDFLGRRIALENVSTYLSYRHSEMTEWEFLRELSSRADCHLLLDINNVFVSSVNLRFDPLEYIRAIPRERVVQMHLAGHSKSGDPLDGLLGGLLIDTHDHPVTDDVWSLYKESVKILGAVPTLIEWDDKIPEFSVLQSEAAKATVILEGRSS